jgi:hypothetical protein
MLASKWIHAGKKRGNKKLTCSGEYPYSVLLDRGSYFPKENLNKGRLK